LTQSRELKEKESIRPDTPSESCTGQEIAKRRKQKLVKGLGVKRKIGVRTTRGGVFEKKKKDTSR